MKMLILTSIIWGILQDPVAPAGNLPAKPASQEAAATPADAETIPLIEAVEAANHLDEKVTVKFEVLSSKLLKEQSLCFLNSKKNHRDADDFAVVIKEKGLAALRELEVDDPAQFFRGKTIAVTGKIVAFRGKPQIEVESVDQIRVVVVVTEGGEGAQSAELNSAADQPPIPAPTSPPASENPTGDGDGSPQ